MFKELDELLRGRRTGQNPVDAGAGQMDAEALLKASLILGLCYGAFMGLYGSLNGNVLQVLASACKVPLLFALTVLVTFPSLYVFAAMTGARQGPRPMLQVVLSAAAVNLAVLASLGPITGFFTLTTTSYPFMKILNVFFFIVSGCIALTFLRNSLNQMEDGPQSPPRPPRADEAEPIIGRGGVRQVFTVWLALYAVVSLQMGWVLRPLVGDPQAPFAWFSPRGGNPFGDFWGALVKLLGG
ncbi:MAG: hypothetical protein A2X36_05510 [Elusimicrobia bacterium GWA2_69_24]|nr:MAG: hypothetical protein A2X36_05510 [Elusimicrobia bacterium GWA2_69_24]HBL15876.1 hypothetical protein [Elusimicrobiota bacterium]